ncbi:ABC transporter ATP-binding protein [Candidatus Bipolaricaulota bacterium]|nr:ABC transporter ATP-binding protein [Candidatus Bipolaricaulota bacterium]
MRNDVPVRFYNTTKKFGDTLAVDAVDFSLERGEFFGLLGPNGAGKTTLIKTLIGLANPTEGTAEVFGYDVTKDYRKAHSYIGFAPAEANLDREFSIFENLKFHAGYNGVSVRERGKRAEEQLKSFDLWGKREDKPYKLSTGMRKKLLFARAMIAEPEIVILDEPTAGLDLETKENIHKSIKKITEQGVTILFTTHQIDEAERLCDRVAIMREGRVVEIGFPGDLLEKGQGDLVRIGIREQIQELPENLVGNGYKFELDSDRGELRTVVSNGHESAVDILAALHEAGVATQSVHIERSSLEDLFRQLTSHGGEDN